MAYNVTTMVQEAIKITPPPKTPYINQLVTDTKDFGTMQVLVDLVRRKRRLAKFGNPEGTGHRVDKDTYDTMTLTPPYIKEYKPWGITDLLSRYPGQALDSIPRNSVIDSIAETMVDLFQAVAMRQEWILSKFFEAGVVEVTGPDIPDFELDLEVIGDHIETLAGDFKWGGSSVDILKNWTEWIQYIIDESGGKIPEKAYFGNLAARRLMEDETIRAYADNRRYDIIRFVNQDRAQEKDGTILFCEFLGVGCYINPVTYEADDGTITKMWPVNKVLMPAAGAKVTKYYGAILDIEQLTKNMRLIASRYFAKPIYNSHNGTVDIMMQANCLPVPNEHRSWKTITVCEEE